MHIVKLVNVYKDYFLEGDVRVPALRGIDLTIEQGEFIAITGPSGSGKSTLMHIIGCLDRPTRGKVYFKNKNVAQLDDNALSKIRRQEIGFVFQQFNLIPTLNLLENVALPLLFDGIPRKERIRRAAELLRMVGLEKRMFHKPNEISGGEMQRTAIARALANNPSLLLADEPTGNLDSKTGKQIMDIFKKINEDYGKTIIVVTHEKAVSDYARRKIYLKDGKIISIKKGG